MKRNFRFAFLSAICAYFVAAMTFFSMAETTSPANGQKVKITGTIVVHAGDIVQIKDEKDGAVQPFKVTDKTEIRRNKGFFLGNSTKDDLRRASALHWALLGKTRQLEVELTAPWSRRIP